MIKNRTLKCKKILKNWKETWSISACVICQTVWKVKIYAFFEDCSLAVWVINVIVVVCNMVGTYVFFF